MAGPAERTLQQGFPSGFNQQNATNTTRAFTTLGI